MPKGGIIMWYGSQKTIPAGWELCDGGVSVNDPIEKVIHRNFNFLRKGIDDDVKHLHEQKQMKMKLVPILDDDNHIVEIVNLDKYITRLPIDAVLMAGGKGERL